jgi:hypothetical protein
MSYFGALLVLSTVKYEFEAKDICLLSGKFKKMTDYKLCSNTI